VEGDEGACEARGADTGATKCAVKTGGVSDLAYGSTRLVRVCVCVSASLPGASESFDVSPPPSFEVSRSEPPLPCPDCVCDSDFSGSGAF